MGKKKSKPSLQDLDISDSEIAPLPSIPEPSKVTSPAPKEADDNEDEGGFMQAIKSAKAKKAAAAASAPKAEETKSDEPKENNSNNNNDDDDEDGEGEGRLLSKKEKEKIKKEKEKAKKKAQAAAKKAANPSSTATEDTSSAQLASDLKAKVEISPAPVAENENEEDDDQLEAGGASSKNKKKKKKAKKAEDAAPAKAASGPVPGGAMAILRAAMEARKAAEEEERQRIKAEQERIDAEEAAIEAEEARLEEERLKRKQREKEKKELAKKEGRLLTPAQKKEKALAEQRLRGLMASGVKIEGLENRESTEGSTGVKKKVVYGNKKKGAASTKAAPIPVAPAVVSEPKIPAPAPAVTEPEATEKAAKDPEIVDSDLDDWDASEPESVSESKPGTPEPSTSSLPKTEIPKATSAVQSTSKQSVGKQRAAEAKDEESGDDDDEDDDSDDDSDSDSDSDSDPEDSDESEADKVTATQRQIAQKKAEAAERREAQRQRAIAEASKDNLRSPICCILGHVDTGKTKLLDKIRKTNVQDGEAGGITQQIGATYFPVEAIREKTKVIHKDQDVDYKIPGLLIIDTPGHEAFRNLRTRGSGICNIAILVVDIMHGLEPQTLESLELLRKAKTPFIVALNKIDRLFDWSPTPDGAIQESLAKQKRSVQQEYERRVQETIFAFQEQGLNSALYYKNDSLARTVSLVPTSAHTGEGVPDMIALLVKLTQERMASSLMYLSGLACTIIEVKVIEGLGTTIDVILSNGVLKEGQKIVICGTNGPIVTQIRALLMPQPLREMRVKSAYVHHKEVKASQGVKIVAADLEKAIAGSRLLICGPDDDEEDLCMEVMGDLTSFTDRVSRVGVHVQASTLGSLEALLEFLKNECKPSIPVANISIGPVFKKDVMRAASMLEKSRDYACMLCFDVPIDKEAEKLAQEMGVRIFSGSMFSTQALTTFADFFHEADIIYHLFDNIVAYHKELKAERQKDNADVAVWPIRLKIIQAFATRDPLIVGCDILEGSSLRVGTPLCVIKPDADGNKQILSIGKISSLEINKKPFQSITKSQVGAGVAVKVERIINSTAYTFGRQFDLSDELVSEVSRRSIDALKTHFRDEVPKEDWSLIKRLKGPLDIQ